MALFRDNAGTRALLIIGFSSMGLPFVDWKLTVTPKSKSMFFIFTLIALWNILSAFINGDDIKSSLIFLIGFISASFLSAFIDFDRFVLTYTKLMRILVFCALTFFLMDLTGIRLYSYLPSLKIGLSQYYIVTTVRNYGSLKRSSSMFWEPGAYQTFLVLAYFMEDYIKQEKCNLYKVLIVISLFTTLSTTGMVCGFGIILFELLKTGEQNNKSGFLRAITIIFAVIVVVMIVAYYYNDSLDYIITRNFTGKILDFRTGNIRNQSSAVRRDSIVYPLQLFLSSPIIGRGIAGLNSIRYIVGHTMVTCTPVNWFAKAGIVYGLFMTTGLWRFIRHITTSKFLSIIAFLILFVSIATENYTDNTFIIAMSLFGHVLWANQTVGEKTILPPAKLRGIDTTRR